MIFYEDNSTIGCPLCRKVITQSIETFKFNAIVLSTESRFHKYQNIRGHGIEISSDIF